MGVKLAAIALACWCFMAHTTEAQPAPAPADSELSRWQDTYKKRPQFWGDDRLSEGAKATVADLCRRWLKRDPALFPSGVVSVRGVEVNLDTACREQ
jgi:hypothetical protein